MAIEQVRIEADDCIGCEQCVTECDAVFEMNDDKAVVKAGVDLASNEEGIAAAINACPSEAIKTE